MAFETFTPRLKEVAEAGLAYFKRHFGRNGLKIGEEIHASIKWRPTFHLKHTGALIVAAEVDQLLYPEILKIAAHDIKHYDFPVSAYMICPLEVFQADQKQAVANQLRKHGFGILTVDDTGHATLQNPCVPLAQHISEEELEAEIRGLRPKLKVGFRSAHSSFHVDAGQGLQKAGQIIEALVNEIAACAVHAGLAVGGSTPADKIDGLYMLSDFRNNRAALGGARDFVKEYRNAASHPSRTAREAITKIRKCRTGFLDAVRTAKKLTDLADTKGYRLRIVVP